MVQRSKRHTELRDGELERLIPKLRDVHNELCALQAVLVIASEHYKLCEALNMQVLDFADAVTGEHRVLLPRLHSIGR